MVNSLQWEARLRLATQGLVLGNQGQDLTVRSAKIKDRCSPFMDVALSEDREPSLSQCRIDRKAFGECLVELGGEGNGRIVGDLKLHGNRSRETPLHQALSGTRERIGASCPCSLASIENRETKSGLIAEQGGQALAVYEASSSILVLYYKNAILSLAVEPSMSYEMKNVVLRLAKTATQSHQGRLFQAVQSHHAAFGQFAERFAETSRSARRRAAHNRPGSRS